MYYFLRYREMIIDEQPWYKVFILAYDKCVVAHCYVPKNEDSEKFITSLTTFEDITDKVRFSVRSNGSIGIRLAYN